MIGHLPNPVRFIVYSDIHYDKLGSKCITIEDCEKIEKAVHNRVVEGNFDFSIFCGDRFLKREPEDEVKTRADILMFEMMKNRKSIPHYHLIGNHDWVTRAKRWHTSKSLDWRSETDCVSILDQPITTTCSMETIDSRIRIGIHALPAGYEMDINTYSIDPDALNILIFHDMVMGCKLDDEGKVLSESGIKLSSIDRPEFNLVFGGDVHIPQRLPFEHTIGGYVGSVLQRNRGDANSERGWIEVTAVKTEGTWKCNMEFVPVRGFFTKFSFQVSDNTIFENIKIEEDKIFDTCCEVELIGSKVNVDRLANDSRWKNYETYYGVRSLGVVRKYKIEQQEAVVDMSESKGIMDDLIIYLNSGFVNIGDLSRESLLGMLESLEEN